MTRAVIITPSAKLVCHNDSYPEGLGAFIKKNFTSSEETMIKILKTNKVYDIGGGDLDEAVIDYTYLINDKGVKCLDHQGDNVEL